MLFKPASWNAVVSAGCEPIFCPYSPQPGSFCDPFMPILAWRSTASLSEPDCTIRGKGSQNCATSSAGLAECQKTMIPKNVMRPRVIDRGYIVFRGYVEVIPTRNVARHPVREGGNAILSYIDSRTTPQGMRVSSSIVAPRWRLGPSHTKQSRGRTMIAPRRALMGRNGPVQRRERQRSLHRRLCEPTSTPMFELSLLKLRNGRLAVNPVSPPRSFLQDDYFNTASLCN